MTVGHTALHLHAVTHEGYVRPHNEDAHALLDHAHTAILADGLGGGRAGEIASAMAVQCLAESLGAQWRGVDAPQEAESQLLIREQTLRAAVAQANAVIHQHAHSHGACAGMGTTLVLAHWMGPHLLIGHVGDSRAYRLRASRWNMAARLHHRFELQALTRDHSTLQRAADARLALQHADANDAHPNGTVARLTRALGIEPDVVLELHRHTVQPGDVVLLCSDGLTDMLSEEQIEAVFQDAIGLDGATVDRLSAATQALVQAALDAGGHDNITVVLGLQAIPPSKGTADPPE